MTVYVGNLSYDVTREDLERVFADYGKVGRVSLPMDRESGRPRGFAFVDMSADTEEQEIIETLDGAEWMGREMRVNKARPKGESASSNGGGSYRRSSF